MTGSSGYPRACGTEMSNQAALTGRQRKEQEKGDVMSDERTSVEETSKVDSSGAETLKNKAQETAAELRDLANESRDQVREHAEAFSAQAKEAASEYYRQGREKAAEWGRVLEDQIRDKPIQSLLVVGGIGVLLGLLWRRSVR